MRNDPVSAQATKSKNKFEQYLTLVIEYGIYLYVFWLLFDKGEGLRNIGLYSALTGWVILALFRKRITISLDIITFSFFIYLGSTALSTFFSLDPLYSLIALKKDVLKATITFFVVSTCFDDRIVLRMSKVISLSGLIILVLGLYSFAFGNAVDYTSENIFLSADKNQYGFYIGIFLPFFFMFFIKSSPGWRKWLWGLASVWGVFGTIFSASRGAMGNIFAVIVIFAVFLLKRKHLKAILIITLISTLLVIFSFEFWPESLKVRLLSTPHHLSTFDDRTIFFWKPALEAVKKRPLLGWGYGKKLARDPRPFEGGELPNLELRGQLHSSFITNLFHQGIVGLLSYLFMLLSTAFILFKIVRTEGANERKLLALALLSIVIGSFFVNSFIKTVAFRKIAPILAMSAALYKNRANM